MRGWNSIEAWRTTAFIAAGVSRLSNVVHVEKPTLNVRRSTRLPTTLVAGYGAVAYCGSYTLASVYAAVALDMWLLASPSVLFGLALTAIGVSGARRTRRNHRRMDSTRDRDRDRGRELGREVPLPLVGLVVSIAALGPLLIVILAIHTAG